MGILFMNLSQIFTRNPVSIDLHSSVAEAAWRMKMLDVGMLPVCTGTQLVGALTDRDIAVRVVAEGRDARLTKVRDVMTAEVVYAFEDQTIKEAARLMEQHQLRRLPVLDADHQLIGVVSLLDLAMRAKKGRWMAPMLERITASVAAVVHA